jgi:hypothetical protein
MEVWKNLNINNLDKEIWKDINGFENYQISSLGRVKSFKKYKISGKIISLKNDKDGYLWIH